MPYEVLYSIHGFALEHFLLTLTFLLLAASCWAEFESLQWEQTCYLHWASGTVKRCLPLIKLGPVIPADQLFLFAPQCPAFKKIFLIWGYPSSPANQDSWLLCLIFMSWPYSLASAMQRSAIFFLPNSIYLTHLRYISLAPKILSWHSFRLFSTCSAHKVLSFVGGGAFFSYPYVSHRRGLFLLCGGESGCEHFCSFSTTFPLNPYLSFRIKSGVTFSRNLSKSHLSSFSVRLIFDVPIGS